MNRRLAPSFAMTTAGVDDDDDDSGSGDPLGNIFKPPVVFAKPEAVAKPSGPTSIADVLGDIDIADEISSLRKESGVVVEDADSHDEKEKEEETRRAALATARNKDTEEDEQHRRRADALAALEAQRKKERDDVIAAERAAAAAHNEQLEEEAQKKSRVEMETDIAVLRMEIGAREAMKRVDQLNAQQSKDQPAAAAATPPVKQADRLAEISSYVAKESATHAEKIKADTPAARAELKRTAQEEKKNERIASLNEMAEKEPISDDEDEDDGEDETGDGSGDDGDSSESEADDASTTDDESEQKEPPPRRRLMKRKAKNCFIDDAAVESGDGSASDEETADDDERTEDREFVDNTPQLKGSSVSLYAALDREWSENEDEDAELLHGKRPRTAAVGKEPAKKAASPLPAVAESAGLFGMIAPEGFAYDKQSDYVRAQLESLALQLLALRPDTISCLHAEHPEALGRAEELEGRCRAKSMADLNAVSNSGGMSSLVALFVAFEKNSGDSAVLAETDDGRLRICTRAKLGPSMDESAESFAAALVSAGVFATAPAAPAPDAVFCSLQPARSKSKRAAHSLFADQAVVVDEMSQANGAQKKKPTPEPAAIPSASVRFEKESGGVVITTPWRYAHNITTTLLLDGCSDVVLTPNRAFSALIEARMAGGYDEIVEKQIKARSYAWLAYMSAFPPTPWTDSKGESLEEKLARTSTAECLRNRVFFYSPYLVLFGFLHFDPRVQTCLEPCVVSSFETCDRLLLVEGDERSPSMMCSKQLCLAVNELPLVYRWSMPPLTYDFLRRMYRSYLEIIGLGGAADINETTVAAARKAYVETLEPKERMCMSFPDFDAMVAIAREISEPGEAEKGVTALYTSLLGNLITISLAFMRTIG